MPPKSRYRVHKTISVDSLCSIQYFELDDGAFQSQPEAYGAWEMVYVESGECEAVRDGSTLRLKQGDICFHKPYEKHLLRSVKGSYPNVFVIAFESNSSAMAFFEDRVLQTNDSTKQHISAMIHEASETFDLPNNVPCSHNPLKKSGSALWAGDQTILIRLEWMLIELARNGEALSAKQTHLSTNDIITDPLCLKVIEYMQERLCGQISIAEMSKALSYGKTNIYNRFMEMIGYSINDYFVMMKINEAKHLIREGKKNFSEISRYLGFSNSRYFSTTFKRCTGVTPSQYKFSCKESDNSILNQKRTNLATNSIIKDPFCLRIIEYMEGHFYEPLDIKAMVQALSYSKTYIYKRFTSVVGCSINDYFGLMKIDEAKRLIRESEKTFLEISQMLGFADSHYFSTVFKRNTGLTPTEYRTSIRKQGRVQAPSGSTASAAESEGYVRFAIVGIAGIGTMHIASMQKVDNAKLVAVCDIRLNALRRCAAETGATPYSDYGEMLAAGGFDCVIVCTPDHFHAEQSVAALEAGYHVLCEKPLAMSADDCRRIVDAAKKSDRKFMVGQVCRATPSFIKAKELVDSGEIGELSFIESEYAHDYSLEYATSWRKDPKILRHGIVGGGCHAMDILRWVAGDPYEVYAYSNRKILTDWPVDDCYIAVMRFPNNVIGKLMCSIGCKRPYTMRTQFYGTEGTILCDNTSKTVTLYKEQTDPSTGKVHHVSIELPVNVDNHNIAAEIECMCRAVLQDTELELDAVEGANTVAACLAAVESARDGVAVRPKYFN